jgi:hypothetical protein
MSYTSIRIEGGLISPDFLEQIHEHEGQKPADFGLEATRSFIDEASSAWADARAYWSAFQRRLARKKDESATTITREQWVIPLLEALGYELVFQRKAAEVDGRAYAFSHRAGDNDDAPPVNVVGADQDLGSRPPAGRGTMSPHALVQDYLNRTEHLWGAVTNGKVFRLLRDSSYFTRPTYIEFDLEQMLEGERLDEFILFYRLVHRTRLPEGIEDAPKCLLERYHQDAIEQGGRIRDGLRDAVEAAIKQLGNGFLTHPKNEALRERVTSGALDANSYYKQLLYLIYRMLFLVVAEERGLLSNNGKRSDQKKALYHEYFSFARLRKLADTPLSAPGRFDDLYLGFRSLGFLLRDDKLSGQLGLPPLNGELFNPLPDLEDSFINNQQLLQSVASFSYFTPKDEKVRRRINYAALDVEELGSVYESLLEYQPVFIKTLAMPEFDFVAGTERKTTGSYYTRPELVKELVNSALVPVIEERLSDAQRSKKDKEQALLSIRVCDPACGSGHFLLAAARRIAYELAKVRTNTEEPSPDAVRVTSRDVITHCIYGVDRNPLAVDLCKVALWIEGHGESKPLTFLDHRIRCGDSLVGVLDMQVLDKGIPDGAYEPVTGDDNVVARELKRRNKGDRENKPQLPFGVGKEETELSVLLQPILELSDDTPEDVRKKRKAFEQIHSKDTKLWHDEGICNLWTGAFFSNLTSESRDAQYIPTTDDLWLFVEKKGSVDARLPAHAWQLQSEHRFFHWPIEFPDVFQDGGFDVVLSNPPFLGGLKISGTLGVKFRNYLKTMFSPAGGTADLCAYFFRRSFELLKHDGNLGMVATNTIGQGDSREGGLAEILRRGGSITFARRFIKWLGTANVEVNLLTIHRGDWFEEVSLDGEYKSFISSRLDKEPEAEPSQLAENKSKAFIGSYVRGIGFVLEPNEASRLIDEDEKNRDCLFQYLDGEDINSNPRQAPGRWVINFRDWPLERAQEYSALINIVEERVKPYRLELPDNSSDYRKLRKFWWRFARSAIDMHATIQNLERVLVRAQVSDTWAFVFVPTGYVYSHKVVVFAFDDYYHFAVLQSMLHETWTRHFTGTMRTDTSYSPTDCFGNFPFPQSIDEVTESAIKRMGEEYHNLRREILTEQQIGLTTAYSMFHDPNCHCEDIKELRKLQAALDKAIAECYQLNKDSFEHSFFSNARGTTRFGIDPSFEGEVIARLVALNTEIGEQEKKEHG